MGFAPTWLGQLHKTTLTTVQTYTLTVICLCTYSGHFCFWGDLTKSSINIASVDRFYLNLVNCLKLDTTLLLQNSVKIWHWLPELWQCRQGVTFFRTQCRLQWDCSPNILQRSVDNWYTKQIQVFFRDARNPNSSWPVWDSYCVTSLLVEPKRAQVVARKRYVPKREAMTAGYSNCSQSTDNSNLRLTYCLLLTHCILYCQKLDYDSTVEQNFPTALNR